MNNIIKFQAKIDIDGCVVVVYDAFFDIVNDQPKLYFDYVIVKGTPTISLEEMNDKVGDELMSLIEKHLEGSE